MLSPPKLRSFVTLILIATAVIVILWRGLKMTADRKLDGRLENYSSTNKITTRSSHGEVPSGARLHLIVQIPVLNIKNEPESSAIVKRQKEYIDCLTRNLISPHVERVHLITETTHDPVYFKALHLHDDWKLIFHYLGRRMTFKDVFEYASNNLLHKNAMMINADCYIDKGFEKINETILSQKTMYALTRHETPEHVRRCQGRDFCGPNATYIGAHDAYVFRLLAPVPSQLLAEIDYSIILRGIEQLLMTALRKYGNYQIRNPCKILHIVHNHCSHHKFWKLYHIGNKRADVYAGLKSNQPLGRAPFSDL